MKGPQYVQEIVQIKLLHRPHILLKNSGVTVAGEFVKTVETGEQLVTQLPGRTHCPVVFVDDVGDSNLFRFGCWFAILLPECHQQVGQRVFSLLVGFQILAVKRIELNWIIRLVGDVAATHERA